MQFDIDKITLKLSEMLPSSRFRHSVGVAQTSLRLAQKYNYANEALYVAALMHDCGKAIPNTEVIKYAEVHKIPITKETQQIGPELYHCEIGEHIAKMTFGLTHPLVMESIRYHATGVPGMSNTTKIVFIADLIEPSRQFDGIDDIRRAIEKNLAIGLRIAARRKIEYLLEKKAQIHPLAVQHWNYLCKA